MVVVDTAPDGCMRLVDLQDGKWRVEVCSPHFADKRWVYAVWRSIDEGAARGLFANQLKFHLDVVEPRR